MSEQTPVIHLPTCAGLVSAAYACDCGSAAPPRHRRPVERMLAMLPPLPPAEDAAPADASQLAAPARTFSRVVLSTVKPGSLIEVQSGDAGLVLDGPTVAGQRPIAWIGTGHVGTMPASATVSLRATSDELYMLTSADGRSGLTERDAADIELARAIRDTLRETTHAGAIERLEELLDVEKEAAGTVTRKIDDAQGYLRALTRGEAGDPSATIIAERARNAPSDTAERAYRDGLRREPAARGREPLIVQVPTLLARISAAFEPVPSPEAQPPDDASLTRPEAAARLSALGLGDYMIVQMLDNVGHFLSSPITDHPYAPKITNILRAYQRGLEAGGQ